MNGASAQRNCATRLAKAVLYNPASLVGDRLHEVCQALATDGHTFAVLPGTRLYLNDAARGFDFSETDDFWVFSFGALKSESWASVRCCNHLLQGAFLPQGLH